MQFITNIKINDYFPENIIHTMNTVEILNDILEVKCAVAYATTDVGNLFEICYENHIPLTFYCRNDYSMPVKLDLLKWFIGKQHKRCVCNFVGEHFHAKVIWMKGYGVYIGSANLTQSAWRGNIEAGLFLSEEEIDEYQQREQLELFFEYLDNHITTALSPDIIKQLEEKQERYREFEKFEHEFKKKEKEHSGIPIGSNPISVNKKVVREKQKDNFIKEWNETLGILNEIADIVSSDYRPAWITDSIPKTAQADQFLHAYYYEFVKINNASTHRELHEQNKSNPEKALKDKMNWWKITPSAPSNEDRQLYDWGPAVQALAQKGRTKPLDEKEFVDLCCRIHAFKEHSRQMGYKTLGIPKVADGDEKICKGAEWVYRQRSAEGKTVLDLINYLLYAGDEHNVVLRLWETSHSDEWKIPHFGLSSLGELIGWALPNRFPPRNGRTNKALFALGYEVELFN